MSAAAAFVPINGTGQAKSQGRQRTTAAQQLQTLPAVTETQLQGREFKRALRQREPELCGRLQTMRALAAGAEDGAGGGGVQHKRRDEAELLKG